MTQGENNEVPCLLALCLNLCLTLANPFKMALTCLSLFEYNLNLNILK